MKSIIFTFLISVVVYQTTFAQYDNPPEPILEEEEEEKYHGTFSPYPKWVYPYLTSCTNDSRHYNSQKETSDQKLINYIYTSLNYPDSARTNEIEGLVVVTFIIKKEGWIDINSIKALKDIGHGCGEEALRIVQSFNEQLGQWSFHDKPVDVRYNLPIRFKLS
jgi:protein TonB